MSHELPSFLIDAGELLQHVSRVVYRGSPLYYGRSSTNRYDDPARAYGVLYLGRDLPTALMESVFHKHQWLADTKRSIALKEVQARMVRAVGVMDDVLLADLTAPGVMAGYFGLNLEQLASRDYTHTQQVSAQVHAILGDDGQALFDGVLYPSRNNYPAKSIALFERAA
ncbi:RES family NAD+ phosphorylase, partial [Pseudomonas aeruginosa]|nr:RES family NAD+ phosphorylase [Pseudomonas aeruginosa]